MIALVLPYNTNKKLLKRINSLSEIEIQPRKNFLVCLLICFLYMDVLLVILSKSKLINLKGTKKSTHIHKYLICIINCHCFVVSVVEVFEFEILKFQISSHILK
jgi:hypothetical protein